MSLVQYSVDGAVALISLDRPPVNALDAALVAEIEEAVRTASDPSVRAVVVTGAPHFAAGADIKEFMEGIEAGGRRQARGLGPMIDILERLEKPTIAAVRGFALGGGLELALGCDFRFLATDARVGLPEVRLGILPGAGGTRRLPRLIGYQAAKEMAMTGRHVPADEALALGIADRVVSPEELLDVALGEAARWASGPTLAYAAIKRAVSGSWGASVEDANALERREFDAAFATEDARTGIEAFIAKEQARFSGR